ncbi:MAG: alkane 1-monooxygenase [Bacteroidia bacterium]|nr:alkane 1-monooxygenase [Bacteroidia bacterium]
MDIVDMLFTTIHIMNFKYFKYLSAYCVPSLVLFSLYMGGVWSYSVIIFVYVLVPIVELFFKGSEENMNKIEEKIAREDRFYDYLLYGLVPVQFVILAYFLFRVGDESLMLYEKIGMISAYGLSAGFSINNAHELGHRSTKHEQFMSKLLLLSSLYMHFFIEHNRGHHKNVATEEDPATSRYGENIYAFFIRTVTGSWISAWRLEGEKLARYKHAFWSVHNEMLRFQIIQVLLLIGIGLTFGPMVLVCFVIGASMGFMLLETVNYIEHYGLTRKKKGKGYERTLPIHSWNSNHPIGRLLLLELSRHSDHHFLASRPYQVLRHFDESPQMPTGYPGMMVLALVPPLWFRVMHKRIDEYREQADLQLA